MSIINLEKTFENEQLVYCNFDNKIIECTCLSKLSTYITEDYYNEDLGTFICIKVKVITIYDIYKNIIYKPIQINLLKDPIKNGTILENLKEYILFFKTFIGAFIKNNKLNGIRYYTNYKGAIYKFLYDNISLEISNSIKIFNIYNNEGKCIHEFLYEKNFFTYYKNVNISFKYTIYNDSIEISTGKYPFRQTIYCHVKNLKIFKIKKYHKNIQKIHEEINNNNEIISLIKYNKKKLKKNFFSSYTPFFSKPLRKVYIELIDYYNKNINNYNELLKSCLKKEKIVYNNLLLNCKLDMINSK